MGSAGTGGPLAALLLKERSSAFNDALARLLSAYDADLDPLLPKCHGEGNPVVGGTASPSLPVKEADFPVNPQQDVSSRRALSGSNLDSGVSIGVDNSDALSGVLAKKIGLSFHSDSPKSKDTGTTSTSPFGPRPPKRPKRSKTIISIGAQMHHQSHLEGLVRDHQHALPGSLSAFVEGMYFDTFSAAILFLFCLISALEMQREGLILGYEIGWPRYHNPSGTNWPAVGQGLVVLMYVCGSLFAVEVLIRFLAMRMAYFYSLWNYLDVAILLSWAFESFFYDSINVRIIRPIRLFRLLRFVKMVRFIKRLECLYFLVEALRHSVKILGWSCLLLFAVQILTALLLTELLFYFYFSDESAPAKDREEVFMYFGSFSRTLLTTFEMAMGNWPVPARVLFENVSEWFMIFFLVHKMTVGYSILGVINAVFVQETLSVATTDDLSMVLKKQRQMNTMKAKLARLFNAADTSQDGRVSRDEFAEILSNPDVRLWLASMDYDAKDPDELFDLLDKDGGGDLSAEEFYKGMTSLRGHARAMDMLYLVEIINQARLLPEDPQRLSRLSHRIGGTFPDDV